MRAQHYENINYGKVSISNSRRIINREVKRILKIMENIMAAPFLATLVLLKITIFKSTVNFVHKNVNYANFYYQSRFYNKSM